MKAITIRQPWASLIAAGVKTIETRPRRTAYRGRLAIHAGKDVSEARRIARRAACYDREAIRVSNAVDGALRWSGYRWDETWGALPLGAVVASAVLIDCVPIIAGPLPDDAPEPHALVVGNFGPGDLALFHEGSPFASGHDDQLPYGDFTPGRWALLLDDIKPTTERCPACWGEGSEIDGAGGFWWRCDTCETASACDPVPARGQQAVPWEWTP